VDSVGGGKYALRVYLSEAAGTILGANFMSGMNVIFDEGERREEKRGEGVERGHPIHPLSLLPAHTRVRILSHH
jgi:hypothetical protein